jgi:phage regulator Rha-like protein
MEQIEHREERYEGMHCELRMEQLSRSVVLLKISGTDVGEFGNAPMLMLDEWFKELRQVEFFIDARDVRGASVEVSADWGKWLSRHKNALQSITMLTGSRFIQITAEFVRRFSELEGLMRICTEPEVFDAAVAESLRWR